MERSVQFGLIRDESIGGTIGLSEYDDPDPTFKEALDASFRSENMIGSALTSARTNTENFDEIDEDFDPFSDVSGYEQYVEEGRFDHVFNARAHASVKARIDQEVSDRKLRDAYGAGWALDIIAATLDPTIAIPGGALVRAGRIGFSGIKSAVAVSAGAAVGVAAQEVGLHATQNTRTLEESAAAIGGSVVLGGLIGAAGAKFFSRAEWSSVARKIEEDLAGEVADPTEIANTIVNRAQSLSASAIEDIDLSDLDVGGNRAGQALANATSAIRLNPGVRTMLSPSKETRQIYNELVDNPIYTRMNMEGQTLGPSVENLVKEYDRGAVASWLKSSRSLFRAARKDGYTGTKTQFNEAIARAGRRDDLDIGGNKYITKAAQDARSMIFDPLLQRAKAAKLLPEDVKVSTAASYVTRMWSRQRLIAQEPEFRSIASEYFKKEISNLPEDMKVDFVSKADLDDYVDEAVSSVFSNLTGRGNGDLPEWLVPLKRGPLMERTFNIPDALVEQFLENDMELVLRRYARTMAADVELTTKFGRADMADQIDRINKDYEKLSKAVKTSKERASLEKRRAEDVANIEAFRDLIRGTYRQAEESSVWGKITRAALTWNYIRLLGGVTLTSITDAARPMAVHGVRATMKEALPALVFQTKALKISRADARELGAVTETVLQSRLATLADIQNPYAYGSTYERFLSNVSNGFSKATGLAWWNDGMKTISSVMTQNRMAKTALNWAGASKQDKAYLGFLGVSENMARRIGNQVKAHGVKDGGIWGANISKWDDPQAARAWAAALNKDVDRTIVTKGVADQPLWTRTNTGKLITQFKSFGLASHQRVLIAGMQENPQRLAESLVFASALGMLVSYLKFIERGDMDRADRLLDNPGLWVANGLDRSGILSIPFEISNTMEKLGVPAGITSVAQMIAQDEDQGGGASRYASRNALGSVLGPSAGILQDFATFAGQVSSGDLKKSGANAIIRQLPGASLPGARSAAHYGLKPWLQELVE